MIAENLEIILRSGEVRQLHVEIDALEKKVKKAEDDGIPHSEVASIFVELMVKKDQYKTATNLHYEATCDVSPIEKRFLTRLFTELTGYAWSNSFGWVGQMKSLTRSAVQVFEACTPLYEGLKTSHYRTELNKIKFENLTKATQHTSTQQVVTVKEINLSGFGCDGTLNNQINAISNCNTLNLSFNVIHDGIPSNLTMLRGLTDLNLSVNLLSGEIDGSVLKNLTALVKLDLSFNRLTGRIPDCFEAMIQLEQLNLAGNQLTGELPESLSSLVSLRGLRLYNNQLSGYIPPSLGNLKQLRFANLSQNKFESGVNSFNDCVRLEQLQLNNNDLAGHLDPSVSQLVKLDLLYLHHNRISGKICSELCQLTALKRLNLSHNRLRGVLPPAIGQLQGLESLLLEGNSLVGPVPRSMQQLKKLKDFFVFKPYESEMCEMTKTFDKVAFDRIMTFGPSMGIDSFMWDHAAIYGKEREVKDDDSVALYSGTG